MKARGKFIVGSAIILACLSALAYTGFRQSQTYYHTIGELPGLSGSELRRRMRVSGDVQAGSIVRQPERVDFVLEEQGRTLPVSYVGSDPLPDTFKGGAQALVEGRLQPDGRFIAEQVQAKCASKYEATPGGTASVKPAAPGGVQGNSAVGDTGKS